MSPLAPHGALVALAWLASTPAAAAPGAGDPTTAPGDSWWVGLPISTVLLDAPEGGLPDENLEALLRSRDGARCDPNAIRLDLATLFQIGEFSAVQADVTPSVVFDDRGEPIEAVQLTFQVWPAPRVTKVRVLGGEPLREQQIIDALGVTRGAVFYPEVDGPAAELRTQRWLAQQGYRRAQVHVRTTMPEPGLVYVVADVDPGTPDTVDRITFAGDLDGVVTSKELVRWARKAGMEEGEPLAPDAVNQVQDALRENLGRIQGGLFTRPRGWVAARVTPAVVRGPFQEPDGTTVEGVRVTWAIEPGPKLDVEVDGMGLNGRRRAMVALGVDHRLRLTRGWLDQAPEQLVAFLQERGFFAATATVELDHPSDERQVLRITADRGARHLIGDTPDLAFVDFGFVWPDETPVDPAGRRRDEKALQAVFDQSSPEVLRRDCYTVPAMEAGLDAARAWYGGRGHLDPELALVEPQMRPRRTLANLARAAVGAERRVKVTPRVSISPGPVTTLVGLQVAGQSDQDPDVDLAFLDAEVAAQVDRPYSPQALEELARRIVEAHRAAGYLEADARVQATESGPLQRSATLDIDPGPKVLLRSVVTRGSRITQPQFVQKEVDLPIGQPVTSEALDDVRADLYDLAIFRTVSMDLLGDEQARDLVVSLVERNRYAFEAGGGLSTDQGVRLFGRATRRNLFGLAHRVELFGQLGLEYRSEDVRDWVPDVANPEWRAAVSYTAPRFPLRAQDLVLDVVLRERVQERTWRMDRTGGGAAVETTTDHTRLRLGARLENRQLDEVDTAALLEGEPWSELLLVDPTVPSSWRWQESVTALIVEDRRDDPVSPSSGSWLSATGEWAPGFTWPNQPTTSFLKGEVRLSGYVPVGGFTLHVGMGGGAVRSLSDGVVPLEDRFRLGGTSSLRGFVRDGVGPQNRSPRVSVDWPAGLQPAIDYVLRDDPDRWTPTGGDTTASGTAELWMPLPALGMESWEGYSLLLFGDLGNVWLLDPKLTTPATSDRPAWADDLPDVRYGVGVGMRIATPVGPLELDIAANPQTFVSDGPTHTLLVDEFEEPPVRAHLTVGATW